MTKQEEIKRRVKYILTANATRICHLYMEPNDALMVACDEIASKILEDEASQGVVIKVDRELPEFYECGDEHCQDYCHGADQGNMLKAGYVAFEPLIEVK